MFLFLTNIFFIPAIRECTSSELTIRSQSELCTASITILYLDIDALRFSEREMKENNCIRIANIDSGGQLRRGSSSNILTSRIFISREKICAIGYEHRKYDISILTRVKITECEIPNT